MAGAASFPYCLPSPATPPSLSMLFHYGDVCNLQQFNQKIGRPHRPGGDELQITCPNTARRRRPGMGSRGGPGMGGGDARLDCLLPCSPTAQVGAGRIPPGSRPLIISQINDKQCSCRQERRAGSPLFVAQTVSK